VTRCATEAINHPLLDRLKITMPQSVEAIRASNTRRKEMKTLKFGIFWAQYLVHARPNDSFGFISTIVDSARRSLTNFNQNSKTIPVNTLSSKRVVSTDKKDFFQSFDSSLKSTFPHSGIGSNGFKAISRTGPDPNGFMDHSFDMFDKGLNNLKSQFGNGGTSAVNNIHPSLG
jgi:hypothetical protein